MAIIIILLSVRLFSDPYTRTFFSLDFWQNVVRYAQVMRLSQAVHIDPESHSFTAFTDAALQGGLRSMDRYSAYFNADDFAEFEQSARRQYVGIGIQIQSISERVFVTTVFAEGPAEAAGLQAGDAITAVDGESLSELDLQAVVERVRGPVNSAVRLSVERVGEAALLEFEVKRSSITLRSVDEVGMKHPHIGYLRISQFTAAVAGELDEALAELEASGMESLIIDLRDNPGGMLESAIAVASRFLEADLLVLSVEERKARRQEYRTDESTKRFRGPLAVLVNRNSASAAEIIAGALRDHKRAEIFGEATFGKASVQGVYSFRRGDALRVTTARYRLPAGELINGTGVAPTHPVETPAGAASAAFLQSSHLRVMDAASFEAHFGVVPQADAVLEAALERLR